MIVKCRSASTLSNDVQVVSMSASLILSVLRLLTKLRLRRRRPYGRDPVHLGTLRLHNKARVSDGSRSRKEKFSFW